MNNAIPNKNCVNSYVYEDTDEAILKWLTIVCDMSGSIIKEKSLEFAKAFSHRDFKQTVGVLTLV